MERIAMRGARISRLGLAAVLSALMTITVGAQDGKEGGGPTGATPTKINFLERKCGTITTEELAAKYDDGANWSALQDHLAQIIKGCDLRPPSRDLVTVVTFIRRDTPYTVVVPSTQPYSLTLLGKKEVRVVVLVDGGASVGVPTDFKFMSQRVANPLAGAVPSVVRTITDAVGKALPMVAPPPLPQVTPPPLVAYAAQVSVPFTRATIEETGTVEVMVDSKRKEVPVKATYTNTPLSALTFSTLAGALVGTVNGPERMKVDSGSYASDPLGRAVTMVTLMFHKPFDSTLSEMSRAERWAGYAGAVLTPAAGIGAGVSIGIIRGLSANVGYAWVWVPTSANGAPAGTAVPSDGKQLIHKMNHGLFVGGGYVFKAE